MPVGLYYIKHATNVAANIKQNKHKKHITNVTSENVTGENTSLSGTITNAKGVRACFLVVIQQLIEQFLVVNFIKSFEKSTN